MKVYCAWSGYEYMDAIFSNPEAAEAYIAADLKTRPYCKRPDYRIVEMEVLDTWPA